MRWLPLVLLLAGCATSSTTPPSPSATDQLLPNHSAEEAAREMDLKLPTGSKVFLDVTACAPTDRYVVAAVRAHLLGRGALLVDRSQSDVVVELRVSANGIDASDKVFGLAPTTVPANTVHQGTPAIAIPEVSLWSVHKRIGVTELSAVAFDAHSGKLITAVGPIFAQSRISAQHVLGGFTFGDERVVTTKSDAHLVHPLFR